MIRRQDAVYAGGTLLGLLIALSGLPEVSGFITDLMAGTTTTGYPPHAPEVVHRATEAGRYWFLMAAWLQHVAIGAFMFVFFGMAWRARRNTATR